MHYMAVTLAFQLTFSAPPRVRWSERDRVVGPLV
jgi:hypothetical protein